VSGAANVPGVRDTVVFSSQNPAPLVEPSSGAPFREVAAEFLKHNALYADNPSIIEYQVRVFNRAFGDEPFEEVRRDSLERFFQERRAAGIKTSTCNRNRSALRVIFAWAVERGIVEESPVRLIRKFKERPRQGIALTAEEFSALLMAAAPHLKAYLLALLWTGGRRTETIRLRWRWFDPSVPCLTFVQEHTKGKKTRTVPVPDPLLRALLALPRGAPDARIFTYEGREVESMRSAMRSACRRAGLPSIGWHVLRRTFASLASDNGMPLQDLQELMGHSRPEVTKKYIVQNDGFLARTSKYLYPLAAMPVGGANGTPQAQVGGDLGADVAQLDSVLAAIERTVAEVRRRLEGMVERGDEPGTVRQEGRA